MSTTLVEQESGFTIQPITYPVIAEHIQELAQRYMPLAVQGVSDKKGLEVVHAARMEMRNLRVSIEKRRKELKADSLEYGKKVDEAAKALTKLIEPIESHLEKEEAIVEREKERLRREEEVKRQAKLQQRLDQLTAVGAMRHPSVVEILTDEEFADTLENCTREFEEKQAREAAEAEQRRQEQERLELERAELARIKAKQEEELAEARRQEEERLSAEREALEIERRKQAEEQARVDAERARLDAEKQRLADEEAERQRQIELEKAKAEAAERAKREAEERARTEAEEAQRRAAAAEAERKRLESLRPDHEKLLAFAEQLAAIEVPHVSTAALEVAGEVKMLRDNVVARIRAAANMLVKSDAA